VNSISRNIAALFAKTFVPLLSCKVAVISPNIPSLDYKGMRAVLPLLVHSRLRINLVINRDDPTSTWRDRIPRLAVARVAPDSASSPTNSLQQLGEISSESRGTLSNSNWIAMGCKSRDRPTAEFSGGAKAMTGPETLACRASAPV